MTAVRPGVRLAVDVGRVRVGLAASDPGGALAFPVETLVRDEHVVDRIAAEAAERGALEIVVGLPVSLTGGDTPSTADARAIAAELAARSPVPVRLVDERLSTVSAQSALRAAGRSTRRSRSVVDQAAAVIILQHALDSERAGGTPPGAVVDPD